MDLKKMAPFEVGPWIVVPAELLIINHTGRFEVPPRRMQTLVLLARHAPDPVDVGDIMEELWTRSADEQGLMNSVSDLRKIFRAAGAVESVIEAENRSYRLVVVVNYDNVRVPSPSISPYKGLANFEASDQHYFFGRQDDLSTLLENLGQSSTFALLIGASGAGKSSFVRAGLAPHYQNTLERTTTLIDCARDNNPHRKFPDINHSDTIQLVVLDHLEILLQQQSAAELQLVTKALSKIADNGNVHVVATLRADWYTKFAATTELYALFPVSTTQRLANLSPAEMREAIILPARLAGLSFESKPGEATTLADTILEDIHGGSDQLPLVSALLDQLHALRNEHNELTYSAYARIGGFAGSLARHAQASFEELTVDQRAEFPRVLSALLRVTEDNITGVCRPLAHFTSQQRVLIEQLLRDRLLSVWSEDQETMVVIAHDALIRNWPFARQLVARLKTNLMLREELSQASRQWHLNHRKDSFCLSSGPLANSNRIAADPNLVLTDTELALITASNRREANTQIRRRLGIGALCALLVMSIGSTWLFYRARMAAESAEQIAAGSLSVLQEILRATEPNTAGDDSIDPSRFVERARGVLSSGKIAPAIRARVALTLANIYQQHWQLEPVQALLDDAKKHSATTPDDHWLRASIDNAQGKFAYYRGDYDLSHASYRAALSEMETPVYDSALSATIHNNLGEVLLAQGEFEQGVTAHQIALDIRQELYPNGHYKVGESLQNLAGAIRSSGDLVKAELLYRQAIEMQRKFLGDGHPEVATGQTNLCVLLVSQGRADEALPLAQNAYEIRQQIYGEEHPLTANSLHNLASIYVQQGNYEQAAPSLRHSIALHEKLFNEHHIAVASGMNNLSKIYIQLGQYQAAILLLKSALDRFSNQKHPFRAYFHYNLAVASISLGNREQAHEHVTKAMAAMSETHPDRALFMTLLAEVLQALDRPFDAQTLLVEAVDTIRRTRGPQSDAYRVALNRAEKYFNSVNDSNSLLRLASFER